MIFRINLDHIQTGVTIPVDPMKFKLKDLRFFTQEKNKTRLERKGIWGIILHITKPKATYTSGNMGSNNSKKPRNSYMPVKAYHRWILCADALNPPHTFAMVTQSHTISYKFFKHVPDQSLVGLPFYLIEPKTSTNRLGDYLNLINVHDTRLVPLKNTGTPSHCQVALPADEHQTFYFLLENHVARLVMMRYRHNTCTGFQCDRQQSDDCICVKPGMGSKMVYEFDILFTVDNDQFNVTEQVVSIGSYRTMKVFFSDLDEYLSTTTPDKEEFFLDRRRSQIRKMIGYVNLNGGWKIIGWCKKGLLQMDGETEKVANNEVNLHLSSFRPQIDDVVNRPEFKALQIVCDFEMDDSELANLDDESCDSSMESDKEGGSSVRSNLTGLGGRPPAMITTKHINTDDRSVRSYDRSRGHYSLSSNELVQKKTDPRIRNVTPSELGRKSDDTISEASVVAEGKNTRPCDDSASVTAKFDESGYNAGVEGFFCDEIGKMREKNHAQQDTQQEERTAGANPTAD